MHDFERRLASRLAAHEESVPAPTAPSTASVPAARSRPRPALLLVPAALVVVIGVVFGLAGSGLLTGVRPVGTGQVTSLEWTTHPFAPGARVLALTAVGDRLIATGSLNDKPAAWYSDDGGETWTAASVDPAKANLGGLAGMTHALGSIAERGDLLVALDAYATSVTVASGSIASSDDSARTLIWTSDDKGETWDAGDGIRGSALVLTSRARGFAAFGIDGERGFIRGWASSDGASWTETEVDGIGAYSGLGDAAFNGSQLLLAGGENLSQKDGQEAEIAPSVWTSSDGQHWAPQRLDKEALGVVRAIDVRGSSITLAGGVYQPGGESQQRPVLWTSGEGASWDERYLPISPTAGPSGATAVVGNDLGLLVRETRYDRSHTLANGVWFVPSANPSLATEQGLNRDVAGMAALPDRFVLISQCGANGSCDTPMASVGKPVRAAPSVSSPTEIPIAGVREAATRRNLTDARNGMPGGLLEPGWLPDGFALVNADYSAEGDVINSVDLRYEGDGNYVHVWQTGASPEQLGDKDPVAKGSPLTGTQWNANPLPAEQVGHEDVVEYSMRLPDGRTVTVDSDLDVDTMRRVLDSTYLHPASATSTATPTLQPNPQPTESLTPTAPTWPTSTIASGDGVSIRKVIEIPDGLMAVGSAGWGGAIWRSQDGREWEHIAGVPAVGVDKAVRLTNVAYSPVGYVATGVWGPRSSEVGGMVVWTSSDGRHWQDVTDWSRGASALDIIPTGEGFIAVGGQLGLTYGNGAAAWTSRDGKSWTEASVGDSENATMLDVIAVADGFVSVGLQRDNTSFRPAAWRSSDGLKWEQVAAPEGTSDGAMGAVAASNGVLVAIASSPTDAEDTGMIWRSTDGGINWARAYNATCCHTLTGVVATPAGFVAVGTATAGSGTVALTSTDGSKWEVGGAIAATSVQGVLHTDRLGLLAWSGSEGETNSVYSILFASSYPSTISRDEAIATARQFALFGESTTLLAADEGPLSRFDLGANQKASPPPANTIVWRVIFRTGESGQLRIVILDAHSGELIESVAAIE